MLNLTSIKKDGSFCFKEMVSHLLKNLFGSKELSLLKTHLKRKKNKMKRKKKKKSNKMKVMRIKRKELNLIIPLAWQVTSIYPMLLIKLITNKLMSLMSRKNLLKMKN